MLISENKHKLKMSNLKKPKEKFDLEVLKFT